MGLAAAQARLLTITARKSDCEFLSMTLSHQKIALSRDMENISTDYQNALNQTKLVYDYYGSMNNNMDLTYGLLMTPSIYNDYYPKLVTDTKNRAVLNSSYAAAARAAGIPQEGLLGTPSSDVRNAFLEAMAVENIITPAKAVSIQSVPYGNTLGIGDTISATSTTTDLTYDELVDLLTAYSLDSRSYGLTFGTTEDKNPYDNTDGTGMNQRLYIAGVKYENEAVSQTISLVDLLNNDVEYSLSVHTRKGEKIPISATAYLQDVIIGTSENDTSVLNWITDQFSAVLGGTTENDLALQYAYNAVYDLLYPNDKLAQIIDTNGEKLKGDSKGDLKEWCNSRGSVNGYNLYDVMSELGTGEKINKSDTYHTDQITKCNNYLGFCFTYDYDHAGFHRDRNDRSQVNINLNNLAQVFLTAFVEYQQGIDTSIYDYNVGKKDSTRLYDPTNSDFQFTVVGDTTVNTGDANLDASFYDTLFNVICTQGWVENDQVDDASYMQEMMKNGMFFISSISDDGYYYQGNYSTDSYISEVTDDEAIAKAEAKYNTEKLKIQNKEDNIDLKIKNLDTEISSLTTEYDTTKSVITKSIEKSFKRYEA